MMPTAILFARLLLVVIATGWVYSAPSSLFAAESAPHFRPIFDGKTLDGWETHAPKYWSVEDGAITGRITRDRPLRINQYLVWKGGDLADFELKLTSRFSGDGRINNGFQFRSRVLPDHDVCGYQVDNNLGTKWLVRLYDEYGRHDLALRGQRAVFDAQGKCTLHEIAEAAGDPWFKLEEWHEYHLTCIGTKITLRVNGRLVAEVDDRDIHRQDLAGALALQLHSGPPTVVQFKDIQLKVLKPVKRPAEKSSISPEKRARHEVLASAQAWWSLDTGGHGAKVPLRLVPKFYQFIMNVAAAGPGARPARVIELHGAYFDAGRELHAGPEQATVFLRVRDPAGKWSGALFAKRGGQDRVHFNLFSVNLPHTPGPDIGFEVRTDKQFAMVSFPVSQINATAWHDLVGRYDGKELAIYCDGKRMAVKPCRGNLLTNNEPLLIAAETDDGKVVRKFHGELETAALWSRPLSDEEIKVLATEP